MWEKACFVHSCFGRKHFISIENTGNLSAFFSWTNIIIIPLRFLYKEHLVIIFNIIGNITHNNKIIIIIFIFKT